MLRIVTHPPSLVRLPDAPPGGKGTVVHRRPEELGIAAELKPLLDALIARLERDRNAVGNGILIGRIFRLRGEPRRAIRLHRNLSARSDLNEADRVSLFTELGLDLQACRSKDLGESCFLRALSISKHHIPALEGLARTYESLGRFDQAAEVIARLIRLHRPEKKRLAFVLCELARQHLGRGSTGRARRFVERALRADPDSPYAAIVLADVFTAARRYDRAASTLRSFLLRWPSHSFLALRRLEDVYYRMNDFPAYEDVLRSCIRNAPDNFYLYYSLARHLRKKHREEEALDFLRRSLEIHPLYVNSVRDWIEILSARANLSTLSARANEFFALFKRSRRFVCPNCLERYLPVTWNCGNCGFWGLFDIRYELPAP